MEKRKFKRQLNNRGFTLVEMIVVLIIMVIALALAVGGIIAWQDWSKMKQLNAHAEDIFMAAQTQLSEYYSGGAIDREVMDAVNSSEKVTRFSKDGSDGTMNISIITDPEGNDYSWNEIWNGTQSDEYQGTIVSVSCEPGDYEVFLNKKEELDPGTELLFNLVTAYIYDKSILNDASIILEFSPDAAQVLAVCYCKDKTMSYEEDSGAVCVRNRSEIVRNELSVGYYGVNTLSMPLKGKTDNTLLLEAGAFELRNEEVLDALYVPLEDQDIFGADKAHTFILNIYKPDDSGDQKLMSLEFDVSGSAPLPYGPASAQGDKALEMKATYYDNGVALPTADGEEDPVFRVPVWTEFTARGDRAIRIALDAADIRAQSILYASALKLTDDSMAEDVAEKAFKETYSFYRFGLDADQIYLGLVIREKGDESGGATKEIYSSSKGQEKKGKEYACVAFESVNRDKVAHTAEYGITNGRHLYNLRFVEDFADKIEADNLTQPGELANNTDWHDTYSRSFKLLKSIDWHSFCAYQYGDDYFFDSYMLGESGFNGIGVAGIDTETAEFPSFRQLNVGDSFTASEDVKISNLTITTDANERYGIYGKNAYENNIDSLKGVTAAFDRQEFERAKGMHPTGLFTYNYGSISGLTLEKHKVFGSYKVGGFVGENYGTLSALTLKNDPNADGAIDEKETAFVNKLIAIRLVVPYFYGQNKGVDGTYYYKINYSDAADGSVLRDFIVEKLYKANTSFVTGIHDVGGICGYQKYVALSGDATSRINYTELKNEAYVSGQMYIGGIIGRIIRPMAADMVTDKYIHISSSVETLLTGAVFNANENRGRILALPLYDNGDFSAIDSAAPDVRTAYYLGGICGMACDNSSSEAFVEDDPAIVLLRCSSYWLYTDDEIDKLISGKAGDMDALSEELRGWYCGGLTGFARLVSFDNCSTAPEDETAGKAYIFGRNYVGGFTGLAQLCGFKAADGEKCINSSNIIGRTCVGGIAAIIGDPYGLSRGATPEELLVYQTDPSNMGLQSPQYGNGEGANVVSNLVNTGLTYAMGNGESDASKPEHYGWAGGICGWNGEELDGCDSLMSRYSKEQMLKLKTMADDLPEYTAACAGGLVGLNSCRINYDLFTSSKINAVVYGSEMVGGAVGYNDELAENDDTRKRSVMNCLLVDSGETVNIPDEGVSGFGGSYICAAGDYAGGICGLLIRGAVVNLTANSITGDFIVHADNYAGGFLGCGKGAEASKQGVPYQYLGGLKAKDGGIQRVAADGFFAGGFAGAVTQQAGYYTYTENGVTEGVSAVTEVKAAYFAGGFAGAAILPKSNGGWADNMEWLVKGDHYTVNNANMTITADAVAGGYYGYYQVCDSIWDTGVEALYNALAGYRNDPSALAANLDSVAGGLNVSGISYNDNSAGNKNAEWVNNLKIELGDGDITTGAVTAGYWAGGVFGFVPEAQSMYIKCNTGGVVKTTGSNLMGEGYTYAGGITGRTGSRMVLDHCSNTGYISSNSEYYGSLCEVNRGEISNCEVGFAWFSTDEKSGHNGPHGYAGGLCGRNEGSISGSFSSAKDNGSHDRPFDVTGKEYVGGLCGENVSTIKLSDVFHYVISVDSEQYAGGVCGLNKGSIIRDENGANTNICSKEVALLGVYVGLIAGRNEGLISGITINDNVAVTVQIRGDDGAAGAFAGVNAGTIENCTNKTNIACGSESESGAAGAFAGAAEDGAVFSNLRNEGNIFAKGKAAGIAAKTPGDGNVTIDLCRNYGNISSGSAAYGITGIGGAKVTRCLDAGESVKERDYYKDPSEASDNYYIEGRISDIRHKEDDKELADGKKYKAKADGEHLFTVWYKDENGDDVVIKEDQAVVLSKDEEISLSVNGVFRRFSIDPEECPEEGSVSYYVSIVAPAAAFDKNGKALTQLSVFEADGRYKLYAMVGGNAYSTRFGVMDSDPLAYGSSGRADMIDERFLAFITGN